MTLDLVARRYGTLPSRILNEGDSLDITCAEISLGYENYLKNKDNAQTLTNQFSQEELKTMIDRVRHANKKN